MLNSRKDLPEKPGIYIFKTAAGKILYIGKAINLKKRVGQYFQKKDNPFLQNLLQRAADIDYVVTAAEDDALLLEANLVHTYLPPFNIRLKDDKSFPSIEITLNEDFPGVYYSRRVAAGNYGLGPLVSSQKARDLIDAVTRLFRLRSCAASTFNKGIPCLYFHIDRCSAPCAGRIDPSHYRQQVQDAVDFLKGHKRRVALTLTQQMRRYAAALDYEQAQKVKQDLDLIESFSPRSCISTRARGESDILVASSLGDEAFFAYFAVVGGQVRQSEYFNLPTIDSSEDEVLKGFLLDFYRRRPLPGEIVVARLPEQAPALEKLFSDRAGRRVRIRTVRQGRKKSLLDLAWQNLALFIQKNDYRLLAEKIRQQLGLQNFPAVIEGYDISHLGERNRVGARVVFKNGRPEKRSYRSYLIRGAAGGDTGALTEVLSRRFASEAKEHQRVDPPDDSNAAQKRLESWREQPDLLLIDGGRPQMAAARRVKEKTGLRSDLLALAKGEERIFMEDGSSLVLAAGSPAKFLFQNIRDEVHRRAIAHHRGRRDVLSRQRRGKPPK